MRMQKLRRRDPRLEQLDPQRFVERAHFDAETAGEARTDALVEALEIRRRTICRDDDLPARIDQCIERVAELLLDRLALQELHVVDDEKIDRAQFLLEGDRRLRLEGATKPCMNFSAVR